MREDTAFMVAMAVASIPDEEGYFATSEGVILSAWYPNGIGPWKIRPDLPLRPLAPRPNAKGYMRVSLGRDRDRYVHRLVWAAFRGPIPPGAQVRHFDGLPAHNAPDNLRLGSQSQNEQDKYRHGTMPLGDKHFNAKLTEALVKEAREMWAQGQSLSRIQEALQVSVSKQTLHEAVTRKTWKHVDG